MANNRLLQRKNPTSTPDAIVIDGAHSTNTTEMAESLNNYFSTVCKPNEADEPNLPSHTTYLKFHLILYSNLNKSIMQQSYNI